MSQLRYSTRPPVPIDALTLTEDIRNLKRCQELLNRIEPANVCEDQETGRQSIWVTQKMLRSLIWYAEGKMRKEYLAPTRKKIQRK